MGLRFSVFDTGGQEAAAIGWRRRPAADPRASPCTDTSRWPFSHAGDAQEASAAASPGCVLSSRKAWVCATNVSLEKTTTSPLSSAQPLLLARMPRGRRAAFGTGIPPANATTQPAPGARGARGKQGLRPPGPRWLYLPFPHQRLLRLLFPSPLRHYRSYRVPGKEFITDFFQGNSHTKQANEQNKTTRRKKTTPRPSFPSASDTRPAPPKTWLLNSKYISVAGVFALLGAC